MCFTVPLLTNSNKIAAFSHVLPVDCLYEGRSITKIYNSKEEKAKIINEAYKKLVFKSVASDAAMFGADVADASFIKGKK